MPNHKLSKQSTFYKISSTFQQIRMSLTVFTVLNYTIYGREYGAVACRFLWRPSALDAKHFNLASACSWWHFDIRYFAVITV